MCISLVVMAIISWATWELFGLHVVADGWSSRIDSSIMFTKAQFHVCLYYALLAGIAIGAVGLVVAILSALIRAAVSKWGKLTFPI